jgi:flagellar hook-associated protein 3 FlgL
MRAAGPTQLNFIGAIRQSNMRLQSDLLRAQTELASGRHADSGLVLKSNTARNISWRNEITTLGQQIDLGQMALGKTEVTQDALEQIEGIGKDFVSTMISARNANNGQQIAHEAALSAYSAIEDALKASFNGQYVFAGINANTAPLKPFRGGSAEIALDTAFQSAFGVNPDDPGAAAITPSGLANFVSTAFRQEFDVPAWTSNWSNASDQAILTRLQHNTKVDSSANANSTGIRAIVESVVAVMHMAQGNLNNAAFETLATQSAARTSQGIQGVVAERTRLGLAQEEITLAGERMRVKSDLLKAHVRETESVDNYEAATRLNQLMTQIETSYAVTGKIMRLSLVNFI